MPHTIIRDTIKTLYSMETNETFRFDDCFQDAKLKHFCNKIVLMPRKKLLLTTEVTICLYGHHGTHPVSRRARAPRGGDSSPCAHQP